MKDYRSPNGERRLWFEDNEIEEIMTDELQRCGMFPSASAPVVDLEAFLELHLCVKLDLYSDLGPNLLGVSRFVTRRRAIVKISRGLTAQAHEGVARGGILGRWRATLAHEAAHVILHRRLVDVPEAQGSLFSQGPEPDAETAITQCFERDIWFARGAGDWKEVQANQGMASLLMPSILFTSLTRRIVGAQAADDLLAYIPAADTGAFSDLIRELSALCQVSREAARIRLHTLGLTRPSSAPMLALDAGPPGGSMIRQEQESYGTGVAIRTNTAGLSRDVESVSNGYAPSPGGATTRTQTQLVSGSKASNASEWLPEEPRGHLVNPAYRRTE